MTTCYAKLMAESEIVLSNRFWAWHRLL